MPLVFRCSSLDQLLSCNGSWLVQQLVSRRDSDEGAEGSLLHYLIAKRLVEELGAQAPDGLEAPRLPKGYQLPAFSAWIVDWAVNHAAATIPNDWTLMVEVGLSYRFDLACPVWVPTAELGFTPDQVRVNNGVAEGLVDHFNLSGHLDVLALSPDGTQAIGIDWKSVIVAVEPAESNWQAAAYDVLVHRAWDTVTDMRFQMCQPRIDEEATGIQHVTESRLSGDELLKMADVIVEGVNKSIESRYETSSGLKQCRYCALAMSRPWDCPSLSGDAELMKATLTEQALAKLREKPDDGALGDFVITGRVLTEPIKAATELLHERLDAVGYVDAGCGTRITRTTRPGDYEVPDKMAFNERLKDVLPSESDRVEVCSWSMEKIRKRIAKVRGIPQKSTKPGVVDAKQVFDLDLRPLTVQKDTRLLCFT